MTKNEFNNLKSDRDKWKHHKEMEGEWTCGGCGETDDSGVTGASPFSGCSRHCGNCEFELTRRTGGGQSDPFGWILQ